MPYPNINPRPTWRVEIRDPFGALKYAPASDPRNYLIVTNPVGAFERMTLDEFGNCEDATLTGVAGDLTIAPRDVLTIQYDPAGGTAWQNLWAGRVIDQPHNENPNLDSINLIGLANDWDTRFLPTRVLDYGPQSFEIAMRQIMVEAAAPAIIVPTLPSANFVSPGPSLPTGANSIDVKKRNLLQARRALENVRDAIPASFNYGFGVDAGRTAFFKPATGTMDLTQPALRARVTQWKRRDSRNLVTNVVWVGPECTPMKATVSVDSFYGAASPPGEAINVSHTSTSSFASVYGVSAAQRTMPANIPFAKRGTPMSYEDNPNLVNTAGGWNFRRYQDSGNPDGGANSIMSDGDQNSSAPDTTAPIGNAGGYPPASRWYELTTFTEARARALIGVRVRIRATVSIRYRVHVEVGSFNTTSSTWLYETFGMVVKTSSEKEYLWFDWIGGYINALPGGFAFRQARVWVSVYTPAPGDSFFVHEIAPLEINTAGLDEQAERLYTTPSAAPAVVRVQGIMPPALNATVNTPTATGTINSFTARVKNVEYKITPDAGIVTDVHLEEGRQTGSLLRGVFPAIQNANAQSIVDARESQVIL